MGAILGWILNLFGGNIVQSVLGYLTTVANTDVQKQQIAATTQTTLAATSASVILGAQGHKTYWFWFSVFVGPLAFWWVVIFMNTILAHWTGSWGIAAIPSQLVPWSDLIIRNIFWSGAGVAGVSVASSAAVQVAKIVNRGK